MYCKECGAELREGAAFCPSCGAKVALKEVEQTTIQNAELSENPEVVGASSEKVATLPHAASNGSFYLTDFFRKMFRSKNIPVLIYLGINLLIITGVINALLNAADMYLPYWTEKFLALLVAVVVYGFSLAIALSPLGEWILRLMNGCRKIKRPEQLEFLMPIFNEVYAKAKAADPSIPDNVQIFISEDEEPNAFATGRRTICVTKGMLELKREKIAGTLAHEFGHLAHHDTDLLLLVNVGNFVVTFIIMAVRFFISMIHFFANFIVVLAGGWDGLIGVAINGFLRILADVTVGVLVWLWTKLGTLLVMRASRNNEFEADKFASDLGYGNDLCAALDTICGPGAKGLFAALASTHPAKDDRIAKLQSYGNTYRAGNNYGTL